MGKITFQDYYGQNVELNNETSSGNLRLKVRTTTDLNKVKLTKIEDCDLETDISLNEYQAKLLHAALGEMIRQLEEF